MGGDITSDGIDCEAGGNAQGPWIGRKTGHGNEAQTTTAKFSLPELRGVEDEMYSYYNSRDLREVSRVLIPMCGTKSQPTSVHVVHGICLSALLGMITHGSIAYTID